MAQTTIYCVQAFVQCGAALRSGELHRYASATEADAVADFLGRYVAGLVLYSVTGEPEHDVWDEPEILRVIGAVPEARAA